MNPTEPATRRDIVVIGASAGGVAALLALSATLPKNFPAAVLVVLHIGSNASVLPALLAARGHNRAVHAEDGQAIEAGTLYVAPPDHHMLLEDGTIRLTHGAKEHHTRPAIDPLFRSAALACGPRVIGVVLTGRLDDGTAGLQAINDCGGLAVVQDPAEAEHASMPLSALHNVAVDRCVPLATMGETLTQLLREPMTIAAGEPASRRRDRLAREQAVSVGTADGIENLNAIGQPSGFTCPDCEGALWEIADAQPPRYRCHTGHGFSLRSLEATHAGATEDVLWATVRALRVREQLLRELSKRTPVAAGDSAAELIKAQADAAAEYAELLRRMIDPS